MHSVIGVFSVCTYIVHNSLLLLRTEVVFAPLDRTTPVRTGMGKVVLVVLVRQPNDAPALSLCRTEVVRGLAVLIEVTRYLAIVAGVVTTTAREASWLRTGGGRCASSKTVGLYLFVLVLPLAELWVLPYKGPEAARSVSTDEVSPHLFLVLSVLPPLVLVTQPLLSCKELEALDVSVLAVELIHPTPTVPESDYVSIHPVVP
jgi:hypothetical protein